jgi:hypothetical protein
LAADAKVHRYDCEPHDWTLRAIAIAMIPALVRGLRID